LYLRNIGNTTQIHNVNTQVLNWHQI
jgi:hypothetical protein